MDVYFILICILIILIIIISFIILIKVKDNLLNNFDHRLYYDQNYNTNYLNNNIFECYEEIETKELKEQLDISNDYNICYPSCKKCKDILMTSIKSFLKNNKNINIFIFNNNEYDYQDIKDIHELFNNYTDSKLFIVDISPWMDIFKECKPLKGQTNCYIRLLMPLVFKKMFPNVKKILYCDEDVYCVGPIDRLMNFNLGKDIFGKKYLLAGFLDRVVYSYDAVFNYFDPFCVYDNKGYICSGLMLMSTDFTVDDERVIKAINVNIVLNYLDRKIQLLHDQFVINIFDMHKVIPIKINVEDVSDRHWKHTWKIICKQILNEYNIVHNYEYKNNEQEMLKDKLIAKKDLT